MTEPTLPPIPDATVRMHLHRFHHPLSTALLRAAFYRRNPNKFDRAGLRFSTFGVLIDWDSLLTEQSGLSRLDKAIVAIARDIAGREQRCDSIPTAHHADTTDPHNGEPRP